MHDSALFEQVEVTPAFVVADYEHPLNQDVKIRARLLAPGELREVHDLFPAQDGVFRKIAAAFVGTPVPAHNDDPFCVFYRPV